MHAVSDEDIKSISPYNDEEFREALPRALNHPLIPMVIQQYFPKMTVSDFNQYASRLKSVDEFQQTIIAGAIKAMLDESSGGLTVGSLEHLPPDRRYVYISNHRDIVLDPTLFTWAMYYRGYPPPQICLGDNLLHDPWVVDLVKMNKGVTVKRGLASRELLRWSLVLSELVRRQIASNKESIWIAQSDGRAKDGNDVTHPGLLKMLALAGDGDFLDRLQALRLVPVAISYEYEGCDLWLAREVYLTEKNGSYEKAPNEDRDAMVRGIAGKKGRIHLEVGQELGLTIQKARQITGKSEQGKFVVEAIDRQIQTMYRRFPSHYIAYDLMTGGSAHADQYTPTERGAFEHRLERRLDSLSLQGEERQGIRLKFLELYGNPVRNAEHWGAH